MNISNFEQTKQMGNIEIFLGILLDVYFEPSQTSKIMEL